MRSRLLVLSLMSVLWFSAACSKSTESSTATPADTGSQTASSDQSSSSTTTAGPTTAATPAPTPAPAPAPAPPKPIVIPAGTAITVRTAQSLGSKISSTGDSFSATVTEPVTVGGVEVIPAGASATGTVVEAKAKGKIKGEARLKLALTNVTIKGTPYSVSTTMSAMTEKGKGKRTAVATGGGAAVGAIIGAIAGGGKGAAIGAAVGGGAGFAGGTFTGNKQIELPAETALTFKLNSPVSLER